MLASHRSVQVALAWTVLIVAAAFGPYLAPGIRSEQVVVYLGALVAAGALLRTREGRRDLLRGSGAFWAWGTLLVFSLTIGLVAAGQDAGIPRGSLLAGVDNLALPLAVLVTCQLLVRWGGSQRVLTVLCAAVVVAAALNAVLALFQNYLGFARVPLVKPFLGFASDAPTVAERAAVNGRFSGVFNQPSESGVVYTLALLALVYLRGRRVVPGWAAALVTVLLTVGGMLALSKVFYLGFFLFLAASLVRARTRWWMVPTGVATQGALIKAASMGLTGFWGLSYQLRRVTEGQESLLWRLTGGRLGDRSGPPSRPTHPAVRTTVTGHPPRRPRSGTAADVISETNGTSTVAPPELPTSGAPPMSSGTSSSLAAPHPAGTPVATGQSPAPRPSSTWVPPREVGGTKVKGGLQGIIDWVMDRRPVTGFGAGGLDAAYDSQVVHAVVIGGLVGLSLLALTVLLMAIRWCRRWRHIPLDVTVLVGGILGVVAIAMLGTPILVGNRMATLTWMMLGVALLTPWRGSTGTTPEIPPNGTHDEGPSDTATAGALRR